MVDRCIGPVWHKHGIFPRADTGGNKLRLPQEGIGPPSDPCASLSGRKRAEPLLVRAHSDVGHAPVSIESREQLGTPSEDSREKRRFASARSPGIPVVSMPTTRLERPRESFLH